MKKFSDIFVGKTAEEIFQLKKDFNEKRLRFELNQWREDIEKWERDGLILDSPVYRKGENYVRSLNNLDETTRGIMRQRAIDLYNSIKLLNNHFYNRYVRKDDPYFLSEMSIIHGIIDGYGEKSVALYQKIFDNPKVDPQVVFNEFVRMLGIDALSPQQTKYEIEKLGTPYDEISVTQLVDIQEKGAINMDGYELAATREEIMKGLMDYHCKNQVARR